MTNLEDIKAPECFEIEEQLRKRMEIPVFHDDQHGTAIIVGAAVLNAVGAACIGAAIEHLSHRGLFDEAQNLAAATYTATDVINNTALSL